LQLGSFAVVLQTYLSGVAALPLVSFLLVMQPIHLAIGLVEGLATAGIAAFIWKARPEIPAIGGAAKPLARIPLRNIVIGFLLAFVLSGGYLAWFASEHPDGLEWAIAKVNSPHEPESPPQDFHRQLENIQEKTSLLPHYDFRDVAAPGSSETASFSSRAGTSVAGLPGGLLVLVCGILIGFFLKKKNRPVDQTAHT